MIYILRGRVATNHGVAQIWNVSEKFGRARWDWLVNWSIVDHRNYDFTPACLSTIKSYSLYILSSASFSLGNTTNFKYSTKRLFVQTTARGTELKLERELESERERERDGVAIETSYLILSIGNDCNYYVKRWRPICIFFLYNYRTEGHNTYILSDVVSFKHYVIAQCSY